MIRYISFIQCLLVFSSISFSAEYISVVNPGFEEPNEGKISDDFSRIPGWSQYYTTDSGVEVSNPSAGMYRGFGQSSDGMIYQLLDEKILAGTKYTLIFDGANTYEASVITAEFYYLSDPEDPSSKVVITSKDFELTQPLDVWIHDLVLEFTADADQAYINQKLGIQFICNSGWFGIDEVRVEKSTKEAEVKEPACEEEEKGKDGVIDTDTGKTEIPEHSSEEKEEPKGLKKLALLLLQWLNE